MIILGWILGTIIWFFLGWLGSYIGASHINESITDKGFYMVMILFGPFNLFGALSVWER